MCTEQLILTKYFKGQSYVLLLRFRCLGVGDKVELYSKKICGL